MKVYTTIVVPELKEVPAQARRAEALGFDGISVAELAHDAFLFAALAAEHTERVAVATSIAVAFPRSPMTVAYASWDIQRLSGGRFQLGLGTQVKGHIQRRFSTKWVSPGPRMREYALALKAIWRSWQEGMPLDYQGKHYRFSLMPPEFNPGRIPHPSIPVYAAAVGPGMCRIAGEAFDGVLLHSFCTALYTHRVVLPALEAGAGRSGRSIKDVGVSGGGFIATGATEGEVEQQREEARRRIAFYASTRTYKGVLDQHGWGDVCLRLHELSLKGRWEVMAREITDAMLDMFCVSGTYDDIAPRIRERYGSYATQVTLPLPADPGHDDGLGTLVEELRR